MEKNRPLAENFRDFMIAAETHQTQQNPYVNQFLEIGSNPEEGLPFHFERRPEIGENPFSSKIRLEQIEALSRSALNKIENVRGDVSPYIERNLEKAYLNLREAYLRLMDI
jgi:hypothetical protein